MEDSNTPSLQTEEKLKSESEKVAEHWTYTPPAKPAYLAFLRFFGGVNLVVGILASLAFVTNVLGEVNRTYGQASWAWLISLAIALEGFLAFGLLNAVADIAENMIVVGRYVKNIKDRIPITNQDK